MVFTRLNALASLAGLCIAGHALAAVTVTITEGAATITENQLVNGKYRIAVTSTAVVSPTTIDIRGTAGDAIEYVRITNGSSAGQACFVRIGPASGGGSISTVDEVSRQGNQRIVILSELKTTGNVGSLSVTNITTNNIDIGGDVIGDITLVQRADGGASPLTNMIVRGDLLGNVVCEWGGIDELDVRGDIGSSAVTPNIWTRDDIRSLKAATGSIIANIDANKYNATGRIGRVESSGTIKGSVKATEFTDLGGVVMDPGVFVTTGDLDANVTLVNDMDRTIRIGGSFVSGRTIALPAAGLTGQITFNNADGSASWSGSITLNGTALTGQPEYTDLASAVGGGSAGVARFTIHDESCVPQNGASVTGYGIDPASIIEDPPCTFFWKQANLRFYGPLTVTNTSGADCDVTVELDAGGGFTDVTSQFKTLPIAGTGGREIKLERDNGAGWALGTYRITRNGARLKCADVTGAPAVRDFTYTLTLIDACGNDSLMAFDMDGNGALDSGDAASWTANQRDVNRDGSVCARDLAALVAGIAGSGN